VKLVDSPAGGIGGHCYNFQVFAYRIAHLGGPEALELLTDRPLFGKVVFTIGDPEVACRPPISTTDAPPDESEATP